MNPHHFSPSPSRKGHADSDEKPIRFKSMFWNYAQYWPYIIVSCLIGGMSAYLYLKSTEPVFSASTKILIRDETNSGQITEANVFEDLGLISRNGNMENEMEVLQSVMLMKKVVQNLDLQTTYYIKNRLRKVDLYRDCPFTVTSWVPKESNLEKAVKCEIIPKDKGHYAATMWGESYEGRFGQLLVTSKGILMLSWKPGQQKFLTGKEYEVLIRDQDMAAAIFSERMTIKSIGKRSTVLELTMNDPVVDRAKDILDELTRVYDQSQLMDRNRIYVNTISFIDDRLTKLTDELTNIETSVEKLKTSGIVIDPAIELSILREDAQAYDKQISDNEIQLDIIRNMRNVLQQESGKIDFIPANLGVHNASLSGMIEHFNTILLEREKAKSMLGQSNPQLKALDRQLANLKTGIVENINTIDKDLSLTYAKLKSKREKLQSRFFAMPAQERQLLEVQRQQSIKQNLYLYLLQKKEESDLSKTVAVSNNKVVDPARRGTQVFPVRRNIWALGFGGGFLMPILLIAFIQALNTKVRSIEDIRKHTRVPLLGLINYSDSESPIAVSSNSRTIISEMFRLMRANLQFIGNGSQSKAIMVTSSVSGEGKSFVSMNLAITLALTGKKVLLIELDLRKPKISKSLGKPDYTKPGISQFLNDPAMDWRECIDPSQIEDGLDLMTCGLIPPNPGELLMSPRLQEMFQEIRQSYDYIIVDTAPVGLVSDALLLGKLVDCTLYVVRKDATNLSHLEIIEESAASGKLPKPYIVLNAVRRRFMGYAETNIYSYGYYQQDSKKSVSKSLHSWRKRLQEVSV